MNRFARLVLSGCLALVAACGAPQGPSSRPSSDPSSGPSLPRRSGDRIRVALSTGAQELSLTALSSFRWQSGKLSGHLDPGRVTARLGAEGLILETASGLVPVGPGPLRLRNGGQPWRVGENRFGGELVVLNEPGSGLSLINVLSLEEYLRGVVPWEIGRPGEDAVEAVKAQAIAARTYTVRHLDQWDERGFDVFADTRDQVYRGMTGTASSTDRAVRETRGQILLYEGEPARAYYSSTCGGHTSTLTEVWDREGAEYLRGFPDVDAQGRSWCRDSSQFRWTEVWSAHELGDAIREQLPVELADSTRVLVPETIGVLTGLEIVERDSSGRVARLKVRTDRAEFELHGDRIRWVLRPAHSRFGILRSTLFDLEELRRDGVLVGVIARGAGFGHGVGLCQTGALGRARAGQSAREILAAYYPGASPGHWSGQP